MTTHATSLAVPPNPDPGRKSSPNYLRRGDAGQYVREQWGMPCSTSWLAKLAVVGGGPKFRKVGRFPVYARVDLDEWATARLGPPQSSTSTTFKQVD